MDAIFIHILALILCIILIVHCCFDIKTNL